LSERENTITIIFPNYELSIGCSSMIGVIVTLTVFLYTNGTVFL